jgi:cell division protein FtsA
MKKGNKTERLLAGLDVGSSKVVLVVAKRDAEGQLQYLGMQEAPSQGMKKGAVVNIEAAAEVIAKVLDEAETAMDVTLDSVFVNLSGTYMQSLNSYGIVAVNGAQITHEDLERVMAVVCAVPIQADQRLLHVLPHEYLIDNRDLVRSPIGMSAVRLEARAHLLFALNANMENLRKSIEAAEIDIEDFVFSALADSLAVINRDQKEVGVCLINIGAGVTHFVVWRDGAMLHSGVVPLGGDNVTNDIAQIFSIPSYQAEQLKREEGAALRRLSDPESYLQLHSGQERPGRRWSRQDLAQIMEARLDEIICLICQDLQANNLLDVIRPGGVLLTGGTAQTPGLVELSEGIFNDAYRSTYKEGFDFSVALATPTALPADFEKLFKPQYSTVLGLLQFALNPQAVFGRNFAMSRSKPLSALGSWFKNNF